MIKKKYLNDFYYKKSKKLNLRSRSWFKIYEINNKFNLFKKYMNVIDLGSSPGGWSLFLSKYIKVNSIYACDIIYMKSLYNVNFFKGDLNNINDYNNFINFIKHDKVNAVISDMLSNTSGFKLIDNYNNINFLNIAFKISLKKLLKGGFLITKFLQNPNINLFIKKISLYFNEIKIFKPNSSKSFSREFYIIAKNFL
ncbi:ribosomal RNA large subunit methyltransferase E [endosymbiont of Euscepes postfasciatus]|uniref:SAM-dependent methyltransferase n=1 Tax=endosymbiont of Euscepes postfasciatus TaxID=650377 RepID=UPI000DC6FEEE|nr:RlmE family RNA methyltransferase [endosymbiont of Euscepes postfasciatus]BBA84576.1 ribosomal RNA large subunit methyltransferase E [endosymbiont of Euscepes postfasciatus]